MIYKAESSELFNQKQSKGKTATGSSSNISTGWMSKRNNAPNSATVLRAGAVAASGTANGMWEVTPTAAQLQSHLLALLQKKLANVLIDKKLTDDFLQNRAISNVCFHPSMTVTGRQTSLLLGTHDGDVIKVNPDFYCDGLKGLIVHIPPFVCQEYVSPVGDLGSSIGDAKKNGASSSTSGGSESVLVKRKLPAKGSCVFRELFHYHRSKIIFLQVVGKHTPLIVSMDEDCQIALWLYSSSSFSGKSWFQPVDTAELDCNWLSFESVAVTDEMMGVRAGLPGNNSGNDGSNAGNNTPPDEQTVSAPPADVCSRLVRDRLTVVSDELTVETFKPIRFRLNQGRDDSLGVGVKAKVNGAARTGDGLGADGAEGVEEKLVSYSLLTLKVQREHENGYDDTDAGAIYSAVEERFRPDLAQLHRSSSFMSEGEGMFTLEGDEWGEYGGTGPTAADLRLRELDESMRRGSLSVYGVLSSIGGGGVGTGSGVAKALGSLHRKRQGAGGGAGRKDPRRMSLNSLIEENDAGSFDSGNYHDEDDDEEDEDDSSQTQEQAPGVTSDSGGAAELSVAVVGEDEPSQVPVAGDASGAARTRNIATPLVNPNTDRRLKKKKNPNRAMQKTKTLKIWRARQLSAVLLPSKLLGVKMSPDGFDIVVLISFSKLVMQPVPVVSSTTEGRAGSAGDGTLDAPPSQSRPVLQSRTTKLNFVAAITIDAASVRLRSPFPVFRVGALTSLY